MSRTALRTAVPLLVSLLLATLARGQVERVEITTREDFAGGRTFGEAGAYEELRGTVHFALDPGNACNARVVDLALAERGDDGRVRCHADLVVLQPKDPGKRSGVGLFEVSNRGGRASLSYFNRARGRSEAGDGLLMRLGLSVVWVGWQFDVPDTGGNLKLRAPVVHSADGAAVEGLVRCDWTVDRPARTLELGHRGHAPYRVVDPQRDSHVLTYRTGRDAARTTVPRDQWRFSGDGRSIASASGFAAGRIYELVYRGRDPVPVGLGLCAIRDTVAFARHDASSPFRVKQAIAVGISQTGRFLRHMLYQGFCTDTEGRPTLDGMLVLTAGAGRGSFNHRFGQPSRDAHRYSAFFFPTDLFPFTSSAQTDPLTGVTDGLLAHQHDPDHVPRVFLINTGYEYWGRAAALVHTSVDGTADLEPGPRERIFHVASAQHFPGSIGRGNPIDLRAVYRALLVAMVEWVRDGREPPASSMPRLRDESLVTLSDLARPAVPGLAWPTAAHSAHRVDYGPDFAAGGIVTVEPPVVGPAFPVLVPQVDGDGNELGGLRPLELRVPVATFTPWSLREGLAGGNGELVDFVGQAVPLPMGEAEGDPRRGLGARYGDRDGFLAAVRAAAEVMVEERTLLAEDLDAAVQNLGRLWDWAVGRR